ncbi:MULTISPECIES: hypothetical protein [unclassified Streptomyces]|uniref:hypothetical protein n=1 Tax=unclassified Streptomyces TaxID=2593676 RepID=UPI000A9E43A8|nr:hypothetical protein [Streptomyces sp. CB02058]
MAALLLPALIGAAACAAPEDRPEPGEAVYGLPLAEQFQAATDATREAGTAGFLSTLVYGAAGGDAVHEAKGSQDYGRGTSRATLSLTAGRHFPAEDLELLRRSAPEGKQTVATAEDDVYVRNGDSAWLRYTPEAVNELGETIGVIAAHAAGDTAPYSGTLADLVPRVIPREKPERREDGSRVYRVTALPEVAAELLPRDLQSLQRDWGTEPVQLTVGLDADGRLASVTADLGPVLARLHERKVLGEVKRLRASYELSAFGEPVRAGVPGGRPVEDAGKVLAPIGTLDDGRCAATGDTGLGTRTVVRPVDCADRHDLRVLAQVKVDRVLPGKQDIANGDSYARVECERALAAAPEDWQRGGAYAQGFGLVGSSQVGSTFRMGGDGAGTTVAGDYTCFLRAS